VIEDKTTVIEPGALAGPQPPIAPAPPPVEAITDVTLPAAVIRDLSRAAPAALTLYLLLKLDHGQDRHFDLYAMKLATRYDMATPRVVAAMTALVNRELIVNQHREHHGIDGSYSWQPSKINRRTRSKHEATIHVG
jgi:hypothetical protein